MFWLASVVGGLVAGGVMLALLMVLAPVQRFGEYLTPLRLIASSVEGEHEAHHGGPGTLGTGLAIHAILSIIFGLIFGGIMLLLNLAAVPLLGRVGVVGGSGLFYGICLFLFSRFLFLPLIGWPMAKRVPLLDLLLANIAYGVILGIFFSLVI